jgi:hypothetical protein
MQKMTAMLMGVFLLGLLQMGAQADFVFSGSASGGTGSATLAISITGNTLTAVLDNTSPIALDDNTGTNAPGITGFGFDLLEPGLGLEGWSLRAFEEDGGLVDIGSPDADGPGTGADGSADTTDDEWIMNVDGGIGSITLDYFPTTDGTNIDGAIFNPAALLSGALPDPGSKQQFFSTATLIMTFDAVPVLDETSTFVRMQSVGAPEEEGEEGGAGSLKLFGDPVIPLPAALWMGISMLSGIGMIGGLRKWKQAA